MSSDPRLAAGLKAHKAGRFGEAQGHYQALLDERPDHADALHLLGLTCHQSGDRARAVELISRAIVINDGAADYHNSLGAVHEALGSLADAAECYRRAIVRDAGFAKAHHNLGAVLQKSGDAEAAMSCFQTALSLRPDMAGSMDALGTTLLVLGRLEEAVACFRSALDMQPDCHRAYFNLLARASQLCDWSTQAALLPEFERRLSSYLRAGDDPRQLMPLAFALPYFRDDAVLHKTLLAGLGSHFEAEAAGRAHGHPPAPHSGRIRLGYVSANFGDHPIAQVTRPVLALHDRSEFEVAAYALAATDARSPIRRAVDRFVDLSAASTEDAARQIRADGIEILVDLGGYMRHARPALFALRPAPVQVYWLGHGGGLGAPYIDYVIGDPILTPPSEDDRFVECIARLPDSFSTAERALIAEESPSRADQALPEAAIVFAAFNNPLKIEPAVFDAWMRILDSVPDSVLWLSEPKFPPVWTKLRAAAAARGIDPDRLIGAKRVPDKAVHLARHRLADLFLDTFKFNASTTALDSLWAGLPVVTCRGRGFTGRIGASYLRALGMADLIAESEDAYVRLAIDLAGRPAARAALRARLAVARDTAPLFDTTRFTRHLEWAYRHMVECWGAGARHASFDVPAAFEEESHAIVGS